MMEPTRLTPVLSMNVCWWVPELKWGRMRNVRGRLKLDLSCGVWVERLLYCVPLWVDAFVALAM
jgi:hypothetical protein